jgi:DNA-binding MarR family transcriptional regulator
MTPTELLLLLRPTLHRRMLTARQMALLALLAEAKKPINYAVGAINLQISKPAMFRNIETLSEQGWVERTYSDPDLSDVRAGSVFVGITPAGRKFLASMGVN